ncbi:amino acid adenylation domain-containing protein [Nostoc sp. UHCC 0251]|uniref:amino acid adenylation domain-containing protein n=1 Tax=Nostoc sp. UHCC 0251 TaxID=3110240 RepID=UPI002B21499B|nr:amino acid adenylation domain-containing protein [Nostoc sp. UHCC 0251]MEA5622687.1 amino acid adenylation domain-containing protein [Nostoc sp. UHCC 0251]
MTTIQFLSELRRSNIKLWVEGGRLRYSAPQGTLTPALKADLSERKAEILDFLCQATSTCRPLLPTSRNAKLTLSFAQQRLWFLDQLTPGSSVYNISGAVEIQGLLNVAALEKSLNEIIQRHEIWRTSFKAVDGETLQVIAPSFSFTLKEVDLRLVAKKEQIDTVKFLIEKEAEQPFDLSKAPLLRATLLQLDEVNYVLILTIHHIVFDAWSMGVLIGELAVLYEANFLGIPHPLPELPIQYADFACWQRQWLEGEVLSTQLAYWKQKLSGKLPLLQLPTDRPRSPQPTFQGAKRSLTLSKTLSQALKNLSQQSGATLFMTLLAAFKTLLYRYTGQTDLLVGTATAGRNLPEVEQLIGCFVNTLVLRTDLSSNPTFLQLLEQVREVSLAAFNYQDLPFEKLVEELQPERHLSYSPLFQVGFAFYNAPRTELKLPGLTLSSQPIDNGTAKLDLTLSFKETEEGLTGCLEYKTELFDATTINRMLAHFQTLLTGIVANPKQPLDELPLLTTAERQQLLWEWNHTQTDYLSDVCIHQLFEAQVERSHLAIALIFNDSTLTYQELNTQANQLAHYLRSLGIKPEMPVGVCMERSLLTIVSILGILKAGGVYLPLDPKYPKERLAFTIEDAKLSVLLTQQSLDIEAGKSTTVVFLDRESEIIAQHSSTNLNQVVTPDNLAYIIYTSGSTGKPKGVLLAHRGLCNLATAQIQAFDIRPDSRILQFASLSFDASISEIFMALVAGATLCLATTDALLPGANLLRLLRDRAITTVTLPPSLLAVLPVEELPALQTIIVAGETCSADIVARWGRDRRFFNAYGPTEATVCATIAECTDAQNQPSIGRPIANTQVYILDRHLQPVPIGVPGELYIGGIGLAQAYLNRPDLTQEKFIPNPFIDFKLPIWDFELSDRDDNLRSSKTDNLKSHRLYQTGDLARYLPDGNIEFLGRIDHQVKIRGFRIELGEIETVLRQHPDVLTCVVAADEDRFDKRLVAYIIPENGMTINQQQLKDYLKEHLPDYMLPAALTILNTLPLTSNGKVDRQALPAPDTDRSLKLATFVMPRDSLELELVQIWEEVMNVRPIGVTDNFFDIGGHSLLAVRLMALIQQQFGRELPLSILFQSGTIEHLATILRSGTPSRPWSPLVGIQTAGSKPPLFCAHPIGGNVLGYIALGRYLSPDQPLYALQAPGVDGQRQPYTNIPDLAAHYIEALQAFQPTGPYFLGGHSFGGLVAFEMAQQLQQLGQEIGLLMIMDTPAPIHRGVIEPIDDAKWMVKRSQVLERFFEKKLAVDYTELQQLEPEAQFNYFLEKLRRADLIPPDAGHNMIRHILEVQKASHQALVNYLPQIYPGKITLLRASEMVAEDSRGVFSGSFCQPALGWGELTTQPIDIYEVLGDHVTMLAEPHVKVLADRLKSCINNSRKPNFQVGAIHVDAYS